MTMEERPATLRRTPRPAPDEAVDPVDTAPPLARTPSPAPAAPQRGRRREITVPFSTRVSPDVIELIDNAAAAGDMTIRAVIEEAVRSRWAR